MNKKNISDLPNGSLVSYRNKLYFVSKGVSDRIVTDQNGIWFFVKDLKWKTFRIVYTPKNISFTNLKY